MLRVNALKKRDDFTLQAQFEAPTPGVVALFGRSGCGKTTLINILSGLLPPDEGRVQLDDVDLTDVPAERRRIGYVFQDARLFPHFSVLGNLQYGLKRNRGRTTIEFDEVVDLLGLRQLLSRRPHHLSGGERQRVGLGRALLSQPQLLLLDEPLASLDRARREEVLPYLELLRDRFSLPMVYVSHQFEEVLQLATHVVLMDAGRVIAQGTVDEVSLRPELRAIVGPDAVGSVLDAVVTHVDASQGLTTVQLGTASADNASPANVATLRVSMPRAKVGSHVRVQLLARDIVLATQEPHGLSIRNQLRGVITDLSAYAPDAILAKVNIGNVTVLSCITQDAVRELSLHVGTPVWLLVKAASTRGHTFRAPG
jgi:molybdate transport system ATP-binding protein